MPFILSTSHGGLPIMLTANTYAQEEYCVDECDAGYAPDENNTCVECDGKCPLKGICSSPVAHVERNSSIVKVK